MVAMGGFHATPQAEITPRKGTPIHYKPEPWRRVINPQPVQKLGTIGQLSTGFVGQGRKRPQCGRFINSLCPVHFPVVAHSWGIAEQINRPFY
jgi:hypothetical protein